MKHFIILAIFLILIDGALASGCHSTFLKGTRPGYGRIPLYSTIMLATSSFTLKTEANQDRDKKAASNAGLILSGLYSYIAIHGMCRVLDESEFNKLVSQRDELISKGAEEKDLPFNLRFLVRATDANLKNSVREWKKQQKMLLFLVGGLNSISLFGNAQAADTDGLKIFSYSAIGAILSMAIFDIDNLWNDEPPFWADFSIFTTKVNDRFEPAVGYNYQF